MELEDNAAEVVGGGKWFTNRFVLIVAALVGLGCIGVLTLLLFLFGVLPPGRNTAATGAHATATFVTLAQPTPANTPAATTSGTPNPVPTLVISAPTNSPAVIPTITPSAATAPRPKVGSPTATVPPPNPLPGLYVTGLRVDPANPRKIAPINFYVTIVNATGQPQIHNVCVEVFQPGARRSFGITYCLRHIIPPGTSEVLTNGWVVLGIHACIPLSARAIVNDKGEIRIPFQQPSGAALWLELQVCP